MPPENNPAVKAEDTPIDDLTQVYKAHEEEPDTLSADDAGMMTDAEREAYGDGSMITDDEAGAEGEEGAEGDAEAAAATAETEEARVLREQEETRQAQEQAEAERLSQQETAAKTLEERTAAAKKARDDLQDQFLNGDIDEEEFKAKLPQLTDAVDTLTFALGAAKQPVESAWSNACNAFLQANETLNTDAHFDGFNKTVGDMSEDPRFAKLSHNALLEAAKKRYALEMEIAGSPLTEPTTTTADDVKDADTKAADAKPAKPKIEVKPASERPSGPTTLANIPSETVDPNETQLSQLAEALRNASPERREQMIGEMPEHVFDQVSNM